MKVRYKIKPSIVQLGAILYFTAGLAAAAPLSSLYQVIDILDTGQVRLRNIDGNTLGHVKKNDPDWTKRWREATEEEKAEFRKKR